MKKLLIKSVNEIISILFSLIAGSLIYFFIFKKGFGSVSGLFGLLASIAGCYGLCLIFRLILVYVTDRPRLDKYIAGMRKRAVVRILSFVLCLPCLIAIVAHFCGVKPSEMIYDTSLYTHGVTIDPKKNSISASDLELLKYNDRKAEETQMSLALESDDPSIFWTTFFHFSDPGNQHMTGNPRGRKWALFIALLGSVLLSGLLVSTIVSFFERHIDQWENGELRYRFKKKKYIVVIGGHESAATIIRQSVYHYQDTRYVIVMTSQRANDVRSVLQSHLTSEEFEKVIIYHGDRNSIEDLKSLEPYRTNINAIYVIGENLQDGSSDPALDPKNLECVRRIVDIRCDYDKRKEGRGKKRTDAQRLDCYMMFEHRSSFNAFIKTDLPKDFSSQLNFTPFDPYEIWAQMVISQDPLSINSSCTEYHYDPIDVRTKTVDGKNVEQKMDADSSCRVHLVVVGMSRMGLALAREAALVCHYENFAKQELLEELQLEQHSVFSSTEKISSQKGHLRTRITFIDMDMGNQRNNLFARNRNYFNLVRWSNPEITDLQNLEWHDGIADNNIYSHLKESRLEDPNFMDTEWVFIHGDIAQEEIHNYLRSEALDEHCFLNIAFCLPREDRNVSAASFLPEEVYLNAQQIIVYQRSSKGIIEQLSGTNANRKSTLYCKLKPFGMMSDCFDHNLLDLKLAKLIHYCRTEEDYAQIDFDKMTWHGKSLLQRWSSAFSSHGWYTKMRSGLGLGKEQKALFGRAEHNRWMSERLVALGERALTNEEYKLFLEGKLTKRALQYSPIHAHLDICSYWFLRKRDPETLDYDINRFERFMLAMNYINSQQK